MQQQPLGFFYPITIDKVIKAFFHSFIDGLGNLVSGMLDLISQVLKSQLRLLVYFLSLNQCNNPGNNFCLYNIRLFFEVQLILIPVLLENLAMSGLSNLLFHYLLVYCPGRWG